MSRQQVEAILCFPKRDLGIQQGKGCGSIGKELSWARCRPSGWFLPSMRSASFGSAEIGKNDAGMDPLAASVSRILGSAGGGSSSSTNRQSSISGFQLVTAMHGRRTST